MRPTRKQIRGAQNYTGHSTRRRARTRRNMGEKNKNIKEANAVTRQVCEIQGGLGWLNSPRLLR